MRKLLLPLLALGILTGCDEPADQLNRKVFDAPGDVVIRSNGYRLAINPGCPRVGLTNPLTRVVCIQPWADHEAIRAHEAVHTEQANEMGDALFATRIAIPRWSYYLELVAYQQMHYTSGCDPLSIEVTHSQLSQNKHYDEDEVTETLEAVCD